MQSLEPGQEAGPEDWQATELANLCPPPLSRGSGTVVESPLLDPLLLSQEMREQLTAHLQRKRLQLLWGLPGLVHSSLERSVPALPGFLACTAPQAATDHQRPLFKVERRQCLEHHLREKAVHRKWGLPKRVCKALCWPLPPPGTPLAQAAPQQERPSSKGSSSPKPHSVAALLACSAMTMAAKGGRSWCSPEATQEPWPLDSGMPRLLGKQWEGLPGTEIRELGGDGPWNSLATLELLQVHLPSATAHPDGAQSLPGEADASAELQRCKRQQPSWGQAPLAQGCPPAEKRPLAAAAQGKMKPEEGIWVPLQPAGDSRQTARAITDTQRELPPPTSKQDAAQLDLVLWDLTPALVSLTGGREQAPECHQVSPPLTERTCCAHSAFCRRHQEAALKPCPTSLLGKAGSHTPEGLGRQASSPRATDLSTTSPRANPGCERFLTTDKKQYFEFHLREKLLHQRWGVPRRVKESVARSALVQSTIR
ncbi:uncharacterized protein LOC118082823 [Zootoca vivipara]|uniref:uncharacterized protein LOC118082823 n=1 Tax=Zootoca vivipara TaxID=8524 RepID=UPI001592429C|nr:uncharacterized protein LOC118082823 [Zootoca vivipara]